MVHSFGYPWKMNGEFLGSASWEEQEIMVGTIVGVVKLQNFIFKYRVANLHICILA
jgi:hypothetical protein